MYPGRVDTTLALAGWLFNFFLVFVFCYLLPTRPNVLNIFCKSTSLRILYIYSLITFTTVYKFSDLNHISKAGPILMLTWHVHNLTGMIIIGPNIDNFFFCSAYDHTRLNWLHLTRPWLYRLLVLALTMRSVHWPPVARAFFLPSLVHLQVVHMNYLTSPGMCLTLLDTWCPWPAPLFQMVPPTVNGISLLHMVSAVECSFALNLQFERSCF